MLHFFEGGNNFGNGQDLVATGRWGSGGPVGNTSTVRTGLGAVTLGLQATVGVTKAFTVSGGCVLGFAHRIANGTGTTNDIGGVLEGATLHMSFGLDASNFLVVKRGGSTIATSSKVITFAAWYYYEFKVVIDDTVGSYELKVDTVTVSSATGVDTRNGGTGVWDRIRIGTAGSSGSGASFDDLYVLDTSGSAPMNDFLGMIRVETLMPQTDAVAAGSNAGLTPSTGTDHGALVDEIGPNTTDYNSSPTVGLKDTYQLPTPTLSGNILGVQTIMYASKSDVTARQVCPVVRAGGTDNDGTSIFPTTGWLHYTELFRNNPTTAAPWVLADLTTLEVGMKVTA